MFLLDDIARWLKGHEEGPEGHGSEVLEVLPLPLLVCDKNLSILKVNLAFTRLFKVDEDHLKGKTPLQILGNNFKVVGKQVSNPGGLDLLTGGSNPKILQGNFPKIGERVFRLHTRKALPVILLVFEEITKAWELDGKIQKSRQELLSVFDGVEDPMAMIDKGFRIRRINEVMLKAAGRNSYKSFVGKACYWALHGRRDVCPGCTAGKTFHTGNKTTRMGLLERRPEADQFTYQITCYPLRDQSGQVTAIAESYRDATEVVQMEEELHQSERNRMVESLAAGVAHEVRNPLAVIQSSAQYCLEEAGDNQGLREGLETIVKGTKTANRVVTALLDFSRPEEIDFRRQSITPVVEEALGLIRGRARTQKVRLVRSLSRGLPHILLDRKRLLQALVNFLFNSLDAMPRGGVLGVEVRHRASNSKVTVLIRDSGMGIPEEMVPKIFQPFYSTKKDGVGLGLPIAEGIIRSHRGRVRFRSWPGKGTEVRIELPTRKK